MNDITPSPALTLAHQTLERYLGGTPIEQLAIERGVSRAKLFHVLLANAPEAWKDAQVALAIDRLEMAKNLLDSAASGLDLARARESANIAKWELERLLKRIYGPSQEVTGKDGGPIQVQVVRFGDTFEGDVATPQLPSKPENTT